MAFTRLLSFFQKKKAPLPAAVIYNFFLERTWETYAHDIQSDSYQALDYREKSDYTFDQARKVSLYTYLTYVTYAHTYGKTLLSPHELPYVGEASPVAVSMQKLVEQDENYIQLKKPVSFDNAWGSHPRAETICWQIWEALQHKSVEELISWATAQGTPYAKCRKSQGRHARITLQYI